MDTEAPSNQWRFAQCFGDKGEVEDITEGWSTHSLRLGAISNVLICVLTVVSADIISTVEFDHTGDYLATGDKGGRVVLFERNEQVCLCCNTSCVPRHKLTPPEKGMRVQVLYRSRLITAGLPAEQTCDGSRSVMPNICTVPVARARVRLPQVTRDRGKDQPHPMVQTAKRCSLPAEH